MSCNYSIKRTNPSYNMPCPITKMEYYFSNNDIPDCNNDLYKNYSDAIIYHMNKLRLDVISQFIVLEELYRQWRSIENTPWCNEYPCKKYHEWEILSDEMWELFGKIKNINISFYRGYIQPNRNITDINLFSVIDVKYGITSKGKVSRQNIPVRRPNIEAPQQNELFVRDMIQYAQQLLRENMMNRRQLLSSHEQTRPTSHIYPGQPVITSSTLLNSRSESSETPNNNEDEIEEIIQQSVDEVVMDEFENSESSDDETDEEDDVNQFIQQHGQQPISNIQPPVNNYPTNGQIYTDVNGVDWIWNSAYTIWEISPEFIHFAHFEPPIQLDGETISFVQL